MMNAMERAVVITVMLMRLVPILPVVSHVPVIVDIVGVELAVRM